MAKIVYGYGDLAVYGNVAYAEAAPFGAFGQVQITHGYDDYGIAPGRAVGDDYSQSPYLIPLDVDVQTDPVALQALSLGISYEQAKGTDPAMAATVNNVNSRIAMWAAKLVEALSKSSRGAALHSDAESWLQQSNVFQELGQQIVNGLTPARRFPDWVALGQKLEAQANSLANELGLPMLTIGGALAPGGFDKAIGLLKLLAYSGVAIAALYFGSKVVGLFGKEGRR